PRPGRARAKWGSVLHVARARLRITLVLLVDRAAARRSGRRLAAGRREYGTYAGRDGWVMRRGRQPMYARGQEKPLTFGLAREEEHWQTPQSPVSLSPRLCGRWFLPTL